MPGFAGLGREVEKNRRQKELAEKRRKAAIAKANAAKRAEESRAVASGGTPSTADKRTARSKQVAKESVKKKPPIEVPSAFSGLLQTDKPPKVKRPKLKPVPGYLANPDFGRPSYARERAMLRDGMPKKPKHLPIEFSHPTMAQYAEKNLLGLERSKKEQDKINRLDQQQERVRRATAKVYKREVRNRDLILKREKKKFEEQLTAPQSRGVGSVKHTDFKNYLQATGILGENQTVDEYRQYGKIEGIPGGLQMVKEIAKIPYEIINPIHNALRMYENLTKDGLNIMSPSDWRTAVGNMLGGEMEEYRKRAGYVVGPALANLVFNPHVDENRRHLGAAGIELALIPIFWLKGVPTLATAGVRAAMMASHAQKSSEIFALGVKGLQMTRAERQAMLAAELIAKPNVVTASSTPARIIGELAEKAFGEGNAVAEFIKNDPRAVREFSVYKKTEDGHEVIDTSFNAYSLSRSGKVVQKALDGMRPKTTRIPIINRVFQTEQQMYSRGLQSAIEASQMKWVGAVARITKGLPKGAMKLLDLDDLDAFYAIRMYASDVSPGDMLNAVKADIEAAHGAGNVVSEEMLNFHAAAIEKAGHLVTKNPETLAVEWSDTAPTMIKSLYESMQKGILGREDLIRDLGLITEGTIEQRVWNQSLVYHGAHYQRTADVFEQQLLSDRNRQIVQEVLGEGSPYMDHFDMMALQYVTKKHEGLVEQMNALRQAGNEDAARIIEGQLRRGISPAEFYSGYVREIGFDMSPEEAAAFRQKYPGRDIAFRRGQPMRGNEAHEAMPWDTYGQADVALVNSLRPEQVRAAERITAKIMDSVGDEPPVQWKRAQEFGGNVRFDNFRDWVEYGIKRTIAYNDLGWVDRDWYTKSAKRALDSVNYDYQQAERVLGLAAILSARNEVNPNFGAMAKAIAQYDSGQPITAATDLLNEESLYFLKHGTEAWAEKYDTIKRTNFFFNLLEEIDQGRVAEIRKATGARAEDVTVDRWMFNLFGFKRDDQPLPYYHIITDAVTQIADLYGVPPKQVQAASWVALKTVDMKYFGKSITLDDGTKFRPHREVPLGDAEAWERGAVSFHETFDRNPQYTALLPGMPIAQAEAIRNVLMRYGTPTTLMESHVPGEVVVRLHIGGHPTTAPLNKGPIQTYMKNRLNLHVAELAELTGMEGGKWYRLRQAEGLGVKHRRVVVVSGQHDVEELLKVKGTKVLAKDSGRGETTLVYDAPPATAQHTTWYKSIQKAIKAGGGEQDWYALDKGGVRDAAKHLARTKRKAGGRLRDSGAAAQAREVPVAARASKEQPSPPDWYTAERTPHQEELVLRGHLYADNIGVDYADDYEAAESMFEALGHDPDFRFADYTFAIRTGTADTYIQGGRVNSVEAYLGRVEARTPKEGAEKLRADIAEIEKAIDDLVNERIRMLGGKFGKIPGVPGSGGRRAGSGREWVAGQGRRGAIGGHAGDYKEQGRQMGAAPKRTPQENSRRIAEDELIKEAKDGSTPMGRTYGQLSDQLEELRKRDYERLLDEEPWLRDPEDAAKLTKQEADDLNVKSDAELPKAEATAAEPPRRMPVEGRPVEIHGYHRPDINKVVMAKDAPRLTMFHEFMHRMLKPTTQPEFGLEATPFGDEVIKVLADLTGATDNGWNMDREEQAIEYLEAALLDFREDLTKLPAKSKRTLVKLREELMAEHRENNGYALAADILNNEDLPLNLRHAVDELFAQVDETPYLTMDFHGATGSGPLGKTYLKEVPGYPITWKGQARAVLRGNVKWYNALARGKGSTKLVADDESLRNLFTGRLWHSGRVDPDIRKGTIQQLWKASQIDGMAQLRDRALKIGADTPFDLTDPVMVITDPRAMEQLPSSVQQAFGKNIARAESFLKTLDNQTPIDRQLVDERTVEEMEYLRENLFVGVDEAGTPQAIKDYANAILHGELDNVPGVKWVERHVLLDTKMFEEPARVGKNAPGWLKPIDQINSAMKLGVLGLNPAYYPMNLVGQGGMLVVQQFGWHMPTTVLRSIRVRNALGADAMMLDIIGGVGQSQAMFGTENARGIGQTINKLNNVVGDVGNLIIDRYPRGMAVLYEMQRLGYRSPEQIRMLLYDPTKVRDLQIVMERSRKAMVDFNNLSNREKEIIARVFFVYPWLKASTYWTFRFPLDHPMQAAAMGGLLYAQQERLREYFPEGVPGYMKWNLPISKEGDTVYGFRMDQILPVFQTSDLMLMLANSLYQGGPKAAFGASLTLGGSEESIFSMLNPILDAFVNVLGGQDSFTHQKVRQDFVGFIQQLDPRDRMVFVKRIKDMIEGTQSGLYPTSSVQDWTRLILGSLTPLNINSKEAGKRAAKNLNDEAKVAEIEFQEKYREAAGVDPPPEVMQARQRARDYEKIVREYASKNGYNMTDKDKAMALARIYGEWKGVNMDSVYRQIADLNDDDAERAAQELRDALGISDFYKYEGEVNRILDQKAREAAGG